MKSRLSLRASLHSNFFLVRYITSTTVTWKTYPRIPKPKIISFSGEIEEEEAKPRVELHKSRGQHILTNISVVKFIVRKAGVKKTDIVLEIGSGTGNLTLELLQAARKVIALEIDPRMIETLNKRIHGTEMAQRLQIVQGDILKTELPPFDICVANIPYQISSPLIFKLLSVAPNFRNATLMLQKEFASRLLAKPGDAQFNRLAVNVSLLARSELLMHVSKKHFTPCPKVDSSVVRIEPKTCPPPLNLGEWDGLTRLCFVRKNKTLGAIFRQKSTVLHLMKKASLWADKHKTPNDQDSQESPGNHRNTTSAISLLGELCDDISEAEDIDVENDIEGQKLVRFKEKIVNILQASGYEEKRSCKLSENDLLSLLSLFHCEGIRFS
ncbi:hypothetical protein SUGI_0292290 [Cryptomeria japonica]|nr:hypothetical protein SUGI_0292290 [Cryptomeria japonica]